MAWEHLIAEINFEIKCIHFVAKMIVDDSGLDAAYYRKLFDGWQLLLLP